VLRFFSVQTFSTLGFAGCCFRPWSWDATPQTCIFRTSSRSPRSWAHAARSTTECTCSRLPGGGASEQPNLVRGGMLLQVAGGAPFAPLADGRPWLYLGTGAVLNRQRPESYLSEHDATQRFARPGISSGKGAFLWELRGQ